MKLRIIIISIIIILVSTYVGCKKSDNAASGQVTFSGTYGSKGVNTYTVTIEGKTLAFNESNNTPACGTISGETAFFTLPEGAHTYTATMKNVNDFDGSISNYSVGPLSVTITAGTCVSVRF